MSPNDLNKKLSAHFTLREAVRSQTAARRGIDNTPPLETIPALVRVAEHILEPVRAQFGVPFSPNSFYRSPALNAAIGGASHSQHTKGCAVDIEIPGHSNYEVAKWISENLDFDQLILECWKPDDPHAGWVHCSYVSVSENRREILRWDGKIYRKGLK